MRRSTLCSTPLPRRPCGDQLAVGSGQLVAERVDLVERQRRRRVRVEHHGVPDVAPVVPRAPPARSARRRCRTCGSALRAAEGSRGPAWVGRPSASTRHGTSTHVPVGSAGISARVGHVAVDHARLAGDHRVDDRRGVFVRALDRHRARRRRAPPSPARTRSRFSSLRRMYSSTGMRYRSSSSSWRMNQGTYSAACSLDSVGK